MKNFKKFFFLILIIFLLQSCSGIKIVIEKNCDCENKKESSLSISPESSFYNDKKGVIMEETEENIGKPELLRYLTGKFTVKQNDNYTYVYYKEKMVVSLKNNISSFTNKELSEKLEIKNDKNILKRELAKKIIVKNVKLNFYTIKVGKVKVLFDIKENKSWNIDFVKSAFEKIIFGRSGKYLMYSDGKNCNGGLIYINNKNLKLKKVFENDCDYTGEISEYYKKIKSFSLGSGEIKVNYIDSFGNDEVEIISLESIK